jgi:Tfp pilus assembly protein PilN
MKIYLDLLPAQRKQEIKRKKKFRDILREEVLFLFPVIVFIFVLLNIYYVLTLQRNSSAAAHVAKQSQDKYQQLGTFEEEFKQVNALDQKLVKIKTGHMYWQQLFQKLSDATPDGIYVSNLSTKDYKVFLVGKARTRDDLLSLKEKLETTECFKDVNVPLSNLVVKNDIDFQIDLTITENCLKKQ